MNGWSLSPALGWPVAGTVAAVMLACALWGVLRHARGMAGDETAGSCARRVLACVLCALVALTPSVAAPTTSRAVNATDVVVAVDVTGSMAVRDATYGSEETMSRLDAARRAVDDLTSMYPDSSFAALRFGASGTLDVPLTPDVNAVRAWAQTLAPEATSVSAGSSLDAPLDQLVTTLKAMREERPDDAIVLYVVTDGEQTSAVTRRTFSTLRGYLDDAFAVGVGSVQGGNIPQIADGVSSDGSPSGDSGDDQWVTDPGTGQPGVSVMDEDTLKDIADEMGGSFVALSASTTMEAGMSAKVSNRWRMTETDKARTRTTPVVWPLAAALVLVLAWELGAHLALSRRLI